MCQIVGFMFEMHCHLILVTTPGGRFIIGAVHEGGYYDLLERQNNLPYTHTPLSRER